MSQYEDVIRNIEPYLPASPMSARQIWERANIYAIGTVRIALAQMAKRGLLVRDTEPDSRGGFHFTYKRVAP